MLRRENHRKSGSEILFAGFSSAAAPRKQKAERQRASDRQRQENLWSFVVLRALNSANQKSKIFSLDHLIRPHQHIRRNRQANLLGSLKIDHELKLLWLFHREVRGLGAFQNLVHIRGGTAVLIGYIGCIRHKESCLYVATSIGRRR